MVKASVLSSVVFVAAAIICQVAGRPDPPPNKKFPHLFLKDNLTKDQVEKCFTETGVTQDEIHEMRPKGDGPNEKEMCFTKCLWTASGAIKANGEINMNFVKKNMPPIFEKDAATITACLEKVGTVSTCSDIPKAFKCLPKPPMKPK